jgi:hypothetical protein
MANLAASRDTLKRVQRRYRLIGIAAATTAYPGLLCLVNAAGYYDPSDPVYCKGLVIEPPVDGDYDNRTGDAGDKDVRVEAGVSAYFDLDSSHPPTVAYIGKAGYASDNHTISADPEDGPHVGIIDEVDASGVWVACEDNIGFGALKSESMKAATQTLGAGDSLVLTPGIDVYPIQSDGGAVAATAALPTTNIAAGRMVTVIGVSDTNYMVFSTVVSNIDLAGDNDLECKLNDGGTFVYTGSVWREVCRFVG